MSGLSFSATGQTLIRTDNNQLAQNAVGLVALFTLSADWDNHVVTARFGTYDVLVADGECIIPWEVMREPSFYVQLIGTKSADDVITTNQLLVEAVHSDSEPGEAPTEPSETQYDTMLGYASQSTAASTAAVQSAKAAASSAQSAETSALSAAADLSEFNTALGGKADLVNGVIPAVQLPSYVDDVIEYPTIADFPATGESGKIYVALDTNKTYRWGGTVYASLDEGLALGETASAAFRGDHGKTAYDHSQSTGNPHGTTPGNIGLVPLAQTVYGESDYGGTLSSNLDTIAHNGFYTCYTGTTGLSAEMLALGISWHVLHENSNVGTGGALQTATGFSASGIIEYKRLKVGGTWGAWIRTYRVMTQAEYDAITPDANTIYYVSA